MGHCVPLYTHMFVSSASGGVQKHEYHALCPIVYIFLCNIMCIYTYKYIPDQHPGWWSGSRGRSVLILLYSNTRTMAAVNKDIVAFFARHSGVAGPVSLHVVMCVCSSVCLSDCLFVGWSVCLCV